jgi:hypothetical protein
MSEEVITTGEFVKNAKHLYNTAIHAVKAYYAHFEGPTAENMVEMQRQIRLLHKALTRLNYGYDPIAKGEKK